MPPHALLLDTAPITSHPWMVWLPLIALLSPFVIWFLNRRNAAKDKADGKREAEEERTRAERVEKLHRHESQIADLQAAREAFAKQFETLANQMMEISRKVETIDKLSIKNESRIESIKEALGHLEAGINTLQQLIFTTRSHDKPSS